MYPQRGEPMDKTFDEAIAGIRKAERGVEVREDLAQGFEYVKQYAEEVTGQQQAALQAAQTATRAASTATEKAAAAAESESAAKTASTSAAKSAQSASADAKSAGSFSASAKAEADRAAAIVSTDKTLSISGAPADAKAVGDRLTAVYTKAEIDALLANLNVCPFEVGDVLHTTSSVSPAARFGGTWEEIATNRVLMGASSTHAAGTTAEAGLPNITGSVGRYTTGFNSGPDRQQGAFTATDKRSMDFYSSSGGYGIGTYINFNASRSSPVYGRSNTVQPAAYYVHIWRRIA
nr:MAG TPA: baseplate protein [Caudoviricetes sp.]